MHINSLNGNFLFLHRLAFGKIAFAPPLVFSDKIPPVPQLERCSGGGGKIVFRGEQI